MFTSIKQYCKSFKVSQIAVLLLGVIVVAGFAQNATAFQNQLVTANSTIWDYIKIALQAGMFILLIWRVYNAFFGHDKEGAWWQIIAIIAFIVLLQFLPTIYQTITGAGFAPVK